MFFIDLILVILVFLIYGIIVLLFGKIIKKLNPWVYVCIAVLLCVIGMYLVIQANEDEAGIVIVVSSGVIFLFSLISYELRKDDADKLKYEARKKEEEDWRKNVERNYKTELDVLVQQYGELTKNFNLGNMTKEDSICIFENTKNAWILGKVYSFDKIVDCSISDNNHIKKAEVIYKTSTSTGNMIGRAVVGGILTGGVGAVVGGATASKNTVAVPKGEDELIHDYTVILNVDDLSAPIIHIPCKTNAAMAEEIYAIFSLIIKRNVNA